MARQQRLEEKLCGELSKLSFGRSFVGVGGLGLRLSRGSDELTGCELQEVGRVRFKPASSGLYTLELSTFSSGTGILLGAEASVLLMGIRGCLLGAPAPLDGFEI